MSPIAKREYPCSAGGRARLHVLASRLLCALPLAFLLLVAGPARAADAPPAPPAAPAEKSEPAAPAEKSEPAAPGGETAPAAPGGEAAPAGEGAPGAPAEPAKPAEALPLTITGVRVIEILPRDYEESYRFYTQLLALKEEETAGGEGERMCTLSGGPLRVFLREQPGKPVRVQRPPWLGIHPAPLSEVAAEEAGLKKVGGVLVDDLVPQGPAGAGGLVKGDIVLAVEGKPTETPESLTGVLRGLPVGKKALVTLWRDRKKQDVVVELASCPLPDQLAPTVVHLEVQGLDAYYRELLRRGFRVYAEPREGPGGGRILEIIDPNDILVVLEEPGAAGGAAAPAPAPVP